jgi:hypothetical protein
MRYTVTTGTFYVIKQVYDIYNVKESRTHQLANHAMLAMGEIICPLLPSSSPFLPTFCSSQRLPGNNFLPIGSR